MPKTAKRHPVARTVRRAQRLIRRLRSMSTATPASAARISKGIQSARYRSAIYEISRDPNVPTSAPSRGTRSKATPRGARRPPSARRGRRNTDHTPTTPATRNAGMVDVTLAAGSRYS